MQDKDITEKMLEKYNDVFADILNVLLFAGRDVVDESALMDALPMSMLKIDGRVRTQERDIKSMSHYLDLKIRQYQINLCLLEYLVMTVQSM